MPKCPNCGRETLRTEDWACQWCGHPLLSGAFKKIPKTYREIQGERAYNVRPFSEDEPQPAPVAEVKPAPPSVAEPEPEAPPVPEPAPPPAPEPVAEVEAEAEVERETEPTPEPESEPIVEEKPGTKAEPLVVAEAEAEPPPEIEAEPVSETATEIEPEVETAPVSTPAAAPALETDPTSGTVNATVAELNAAFTSDKAGTNNKLMDKVLQVTGTVDKVFARDNLDIFYIILAGAGGPSAWQVRCTFSSEHSADLSRLTDGQTATVQGTYVGYERNIILKECSLLN